MNKVIPILFYGFLCFCLGAEELKVTVEDRDLELPLEGVTLTLNGTKTTAVTDADGNALLELPASFTRAILIASLPGYKEQKTPVSAGQKTIKIPLTIQDIMVGNELVVESTVPGKTDEKVGVSMVMDKDEMKTTANVGLVEDIMTSIGTLPGVGFTGGFDAQPSIRGGYPDEMGTTLDDVYILNPYHWGGAYSIFNPNMVDSAKLSSGVYSARYGRAMSGLLEVTTVKPDSQEVRVNASISTMSSEVFIQIPLGSKAGLFIGGKASYLEPLIMANDAFNISGIQIAKIIPTAPYIRDFYAKGYLNPTPNLEITANAFLGSDGVGIDSETNNDGITTLTKFNWFNMIGFAAANVKWLPTKNSIVHFVGGYNNNTDDIDLNYSISGTKKYSEAFIAKYDGSAVDTDGAVDGKIGGATSYKIDDLGTTGFSRQVLQQLQGKLETDILLGSSNMISFGADEVAQFLHSEQEFTGWTLIDTVYPHKYVNVTTENNLDGNKVLNSAAFATWSFGSEQSAIKGELGIRGEHYYLWNSNFKLNTYPVADPRFSISWVPLSGKGNLDKLTLTAGTGFFSMFSSDSIAADDKYGIKSFEVGPNRAWFQMLGGEAEMADDWSFRLEGYYKRYFNRLYIAYNYNDTTKKVDYTAKTDGIGNVEGFDLMLRKKNGRFFDGYISYSFVIAQYLNPTAPKVQDETTTSGDPLNEWYFPSYHRFHTLNIVLNWKPVTGLVITTSATIATGKPKTSVGQVTMEPVIYDGKVIERYTRTSSYDSTSRTDISCPVNLRIGYSNYYPNTKIRWEYYVGAEDIFVNLYSPKANKGFDEQTGKESEASDTADFNIGIPMISAGYKVSY